jgi:toxin FitB
VNVVDSCGWLEYYADGPNAARFAPVIRDPSHLLVPTISIYEVFKKVLLQFGEKEALAAVSDMSQGKVIDLDREIAMEAAKLSLDRRLPMADSIMLVTARRHAAVFWTEDIHFRDFPGVKYFEKK